MRLVEEGIDMFDEKSIPLGISSFKEIRSKQFYYVDKTFFLEKILGHGSMVLMIARPRGFGKTLMLDMVNTFLDINHAEENRSLFDGLYIEGNKPIMEKYQGKIPVIYIPFKNFHGTTYESFSANLADEMKRIPLLNFKGMIDSPNLGRHLLPYMDAILEPSKDYMSINNFLLDMTRLVSMHFGKKVSVLIDDYDSPVNNIEFKSMDDKRKSLKLIWKFMGKALKDNRHLAFSVITGISPVADENMLNEFNNFYIADIKNSVFAEGFGFTNKDLDNILNDFGVERHLWYMFNQNNVYRLDKNQVFNSCLVWEFIRRYIERLC